MKKQVVVCAIAIATLFTSSCTDESQSVYEASDLSNLSEEQLEKVAYGCTSYTAADDGDEKVETSATEEYIDMLRERIREEETASGNKAVAATQYVGVVKDQTCGKYDEIRIYYDCQDHSANDTYSRGYKGSWTVTQNITMRFCLVPGHLFKRTKDHYAVMNFSPDHYFGNDIQHKDVGLVNAYMDAEDSKCASAMFYTKYGSKEKRVNNNIHSGNTHLSGNGNLSYQMFYFKANNNSTDSYPDLGFDYGIFGSLLDETSENQGFVHSDDEDSHNANNAQIDIDSKTNVNIKNSNFYGILTVDRNTSFCIAKIKTKK